MRALVRRERSLIDRATVTAKSHFVSIARRFKHVGVSSSRGGHNRHNPGCTSKKCIDPVLNVDSLVGDHSYGDKHRSLFVRNACERSLWISRSM